MFLRIFLLVLLPLSFCSCRVFFPSLIDLADFEQIDFSTSRVVQVTRRVQRIFDTW